MHPKNEAALHGRVARAAAAALASQKYVSAIDVLVGIGWLQPSRVDDWRHRRLAFLEAAVQANLSKISAAMKTFRAWARAAGLKPSETAYVARSAGREPLRFSKSGTEAIERAYRTHWISAALSERKRARVAAKAATPPELVAVEPRREWACHRCSGTGAWLVMEAEGPACLRCLGFGELVWLPSGNAAVTRRARAASAQSLPVVRWSRARKHYERIGLLVEQAALDQATKASEAVLDDDLDGIPF